MPIETEVLQRRATPGSPAYWIDRDRYELTDLALEPDETRALQLAVATVRSASGGEIAAGELALWKLGATSADAERPGGRALCRSCRRCRRCATPPPGARR